ncbi:hypothetical protein JSY14_06710 [Brachybacterium sp. EF45031]|uniref:bile acid:sodium symporter n=1 Tax=Brachybacterium sillae TaxID=2810536 RepID=UPI00217E0A23|nr:bile acid:sodium symporter [Brachybacterium sillae]MCS6711726.1 hypothetical protein [Brachybacterium sillae]
MSEILDVVLRIALQVFVLGSMLNVGLGQKPSQIAHHLRKRRFLTRMLMINLVAVPGIMTYLIMLFQPTEEYAAALLLLGLCAGAPFLIKLADTAAEDLALAASVMLVLVAGTVIEVPLVLPRLVAGLEVDGLEIARSLTLQLVVPILIDMVLQKLLGETAQKARPWIARLANIALYVLLALTILTNLDALTDLQLWKAAAIGVGALLLAFLIGYMMGDDESHLKDVGGLATAQLGTAAAIIVASQNFSDERVFVFINVLNALNMVLLVAAAKAMDPDNDFLPLGWSKEQADAERR